MRVLDSEQLPVMAEMEAPDAGWYKLQRKRLALRRDVQIDSLLIDTKEEVRIGRC